jgi:hypothetical protein
MAYCIFVTHQISPVLPSFFRWAEYPVYRIIRWIIEYYDECWIPDYSDSEKNLSGKLSHRFRLPLNAKYIGILSRFTALPVNGPNIKGKFELVFVLSGPEPQLGVFYETCRKLALKTHLKSLIINGLRQDTTSDNNSVGELVSEVSHLDPLDFKQVLVHARAIVCRSGYSGIMDLITLGKTALLVPTPGQPEQEYLAGYLSSKRLFTCVPQDELNETIILDYMNRRLISKEYDHHGQKAQ